MASKTHLSDVICSYAPWKWERQYPKGRRGVRCFSCKIFLTGWWILSVKPSELLFGRHGWLGRCSCSWWRFLSWVSWSLGQGFRGSMIGWIWGWACSLRCLRPTKSPLIYRTKNSKAWLLSPTKSVESYPSSPQRACNHQRRDLQWYSEPLLESLTSAAKMLFSWPLWWI